MENKNSNIQTSEDKNSKPGNTDSKNKSAQATNEDTDDDLKEHRSNTAKNIGPNNDVERE